MSRCNGHIANQVRGRRRRGIGLLAALVGLALVAGCRGKAPAGETAPLAGAATTAATVATTTGPTAATTAATASAAGKGSPFPAQSGGNAGPGNVRVAALSTPGIPGVPRLWIPAASRSPFRPEGLAGSGKRWESGGPEIPVVTPKAGGGNPLDPMKELFSTFPPAHVGPLPTPRGLTTDRNVGANTRDLPLPIVRPSFHLRGIIQGHPLMAIIEGEKSHYIVQQGDPVADGYTVGSISLQKVVLRTGSSGTLILRLGDERG